MIVKQKAVNTKYSRVLGISNMDFTPAEITATGVLPSSVRSDDMSIAEKQAGTINLGQKFANYWISNP